MFNRFIRAGLNKVPIVYWLSNSSASKVSGHERSFIKTVAIVAVCIIYYSAANCFAQEQKKDTRGVVFYMIYDSNKPFNLQRMVLSYSTSKWIKQKYDSLVINQRENSKTPDSIVFHTGFAGPEYVTLKLYLKDKAIKSNTVYVSSGNALFEATLNDNDLKVKPKLSDGGLLNQNSLQGLALILQAILEIFIAWIILKAFGLPRQVILMVLTANIAAFPLYLLHLPNVLATEAIVFITKAAIMIVIGLRKMPVYRIIALLIALTIIGLGFKELFFFIARII